jgi:hypothetical protein
MMFSKLDTLKLHEQSFFALMIVIGVVAVWRGLWGLMDLYLFPGEPTMSFCVSILIGLAILSATHYTVKELT